MDNKILAILRRLELGNEAKTQDLSIAERRIAALEQEIAELTGSDSSYVSTESQIDFIRKVAESRTKFAKEARDIIDAIDSPDVQNEQS